MVDRYTFRSNLARIHAELTDGRRTLCRHERAQNSPHSKQNGIKIEAIEIWTNLDPTLGYL